jgi:hypothetical protein
MHATNRAAGETIKLGHPAGLANHRHSPPVAVGSSSPSAYATMPNQAAERAGMGAQDELGLDGSRREQMLAMPPERKWNLLQQHKGRQDDKQRGVTTVPATPYGNHSR